MQPVQLDPTTDATEPRSFGQDDRPPRISRLAGLYVVPARDVAMDPPLDPAAQDDHAARIARHGRFTAQRMLKRHENLMAKYEWHLRQADFDRAHDYHWRAMAALDTPPGRLSLLAWAVIALVIVGLAVVALP